MKLKFQKVTDIDYNIDYDWLLVIDNEEDLISYHKNLMSSKLQRAWKNLIDTAEGRAHMDNAITQLLFNKLETLDPEQRTSILEETINLFDRLYKDKLEYISKYGKIYINKMGGYFPHRGSISISDEMVIDEGTVKFPNYTKEDIRTKQWEGGTHYYAYVGDFQAEDYHGRKKWDTEKEAQESASWYLWKLNQKHFDFKNT